MRLYLRAPFAVSSITLCVISGCDKVKEAIHHHTAPDDSVGIKTDPPAANAPAVPEAGVVPAAAADAAVDAGPPDAGKKAPAPVAVSATAKKPPKLNGLPAGAPCVQGPEGNGGCASGSECTNGKCTCYNGWTSCDGACRDLTRDPYNCDKCGRECKYGQYCKWGHCE